MLAVSVNKMLVLSVLEALPPSAHPSAKTVKPATSESGYEAFEIMREEKKRRERKSQCRHDEAAKAYNFY